MIKLISRYMQFYKYLDNFYLSNIKVKFILFHKNNSIYNYPVLTTTFQIPL